RRDAPEDAAERRAHLVRADLAPVTGRELEVAARQRRPPCPRPHEREERSKLEQLERLHGRRQARGTAQLAARTSCIDLGVDLTEESLRVRPRVEVPELRSRVADPAPRGERARGDAGIEP